MNEKEGKIIFEDEISEIKDSLIKIFDELIKVSHQLPRPESFLRKVDKMFLPEMIFED